MAKFQRPKPITPAIQLLNLRKLYPQSIGQLKSSRLTWDVYLRPSSLSYTYHVRIEYKPKSNPKCFVIEPKLQRYKNKKLPHVYSEEPFPRLCLYYPKAREWTSSHLIAYTIVPWACEWLYFYEIWLVTGNWHADEVSHTGFKIDS